jgi:hypothetical protein
VNVGILKRIDSTDGGPPENRCAKLVLRLGSGKDITLVRTHPSVKSERGFTWRGVLRERFCHRQTSASVGNTLTEHAKLVVPRLLEGICHRVR